MIFWALWIKVIIHFKHNKKNWQDVNLRIKDTILLLSKTRLRNFSVIIISWIYIPPTSHCINILQD